MCTLGNGLYTCNEKEQRQLHPERLTQKQDVQRFDGPPVVDQLKSHQQHQRQQGRQIGDQRPVDHCLQIGPCKGIRSSEFVKPLGGSAQSDKGHRNYEIQKAD